VKVICNALVFAFPFVAILFSTAFSFQGPFQVKNLYPIILHANQPYIEKAAMENSLSLSLSHSSTYTVQESGHWTVHLDMEITELNFRYKRIIKDFLEFNIDVPLQYWGGGFMDPFLADYHSTFGFPDYGRSNRPHNEFLYEVRKDGELVVRGKSGLRLGDIRLAVKKPLISSDSYTLSIRGEVEIPVSDAEKGYSNGSLDAGVSVNFDKRIHEKVMTYWNAGAVFPGDVKGHRRVDLKNFIYGAGALEAYVGKGISALVQVLGQSRIYPKTDLRAVDRAAVLIAFGGRYTTGKNSFDLSLTEDLSEAAAPDFIINLTYKRSL
jgi:hypothetical protein